MEMPITLPVGAVQPRRLVDIISRLPPGADPNPLRWINGVSWEPWQCYALVVDSDDDCDPLQGDMPVGLTPHECVNHLVQKSFRINDAMKMTLLDPAAVTVPEVMVLRYNMQIGATFAAELLSADGSGGYGLANVATAPNGAAFADPPSSPAYGLQVLEQEIAERLQGGVGIIHCGPGILSRLVAECGVRLNLNNVWETPAGNIVISDAGYINAPEPTGGAISGEGSDWMYASGPVWFEATSPMAIGIGRETLEGKDENSTTPWDRNTIVQYLQGFGILVFDPCPVTAVLVGFNELNEPYGS
jgi:hypothetical protein